MLINMGTELISYITLNIVLLQLYYCMYINVCTLLCCFTLFVRKQSQIETAKATQITKMCIGWQLITKYDCGILLGIHKLFQILQQEDY